MNKIFKELVGKFPKAGMALHGTTLGKALLIRKEGLNPPEGIPFYCPIPYPFYLGKKLYPDRELLERAIGSVLSAANYTTEKSISNKNLKEQELPAIVIFKGKTDQYGGEFSAGYHKDLPQSKMGRIRAYRSFGTETGKIPPDRVGAIVNINRWEQSEILGKAGGNETKATVLARNLLVSKTLKKLKEIILAEKPVTPR